MRGRSICRSASLPSQTASNVSVLGRPGRCLEVTGIHQPDLEPMGFQQVEEAPLQESLVASITTRVTASSASRSTMTSSQRVIVW
jgi:hypothetical protein